VVGVELALAKRAGRLSALLGERVNAELARMGLTKAEYEILAVLRASGAPYRLRPSDLASSPTCCAACRRRPSRPPSRHCASCSWPSATRPRSAEAHRGC